MTGEDDRGNVRSYILLPPRLCHHRISHSLLDQSYPGLDGTSQILLLPRFHFYEPNSMFQKTFTL